MLDTPGLNEIPICPRCRCLASLQLRASLQEKDGFPKVECLECSVCGEVLLVECGLGDDGTKKPALPIAA
jgi:hypothetical protein